MKPFMKRRKSSEFCSTCHKVHLDVPVNNYRWFRGFNDYDNWQASGFGDGARSFYYPKEGKTCAGCHMPLEHFDRTGSSEGWPRAFAPLCCGEYLGFARQSGSGSDRGGSRNFEPRAFITLDIFAASPVEKKTAASKPI